MKRREFILLLGGAAAAWPIAARAQQPARDAPGQDRERVAQVVYLGIGAPGWSLEALRAGMRAQGFEEGRNLVLHIRTADRYDQLRAQAAELVARGVDVIYARGDTAASAARAATAEIPIVMAGSLDPVAQGLAASLARPGGNVTGLLGFATELIAKRLELLREALPGLTQVGIIYAPTSPQQVEGVRNARAAADGLGLRLVVREITTVDDIEPALAAIAAAGARALAPVASTMLVYNQARVVELARRHGLGAIYFDRSFVDAGGLMSYGINMAARDRRAGEYIGRILRGARPGELPIEQVERLELVISLGAARALGLTIPPALLARADEVIE